MFQIGRVYDRRKDLHQSYGVQEQGGISTPANHPFIFLFTGNSGEAFGYRDGWDENGVFLYTGEGQRGDMQFVRGNRAIQSHAEDGKTLHLFEVLGKRKGCRYVGEFVCSSWQYQHSPDVTNAERQAIVFNLIRLDDVETNDTQLNTDSIMNLRSRAIAAAGQLAQGDASVAMRTVYSRSSVVRDYVLARANGICESCRNPSPFKRADGSPYLEPHHTRRVSDGGPDHPRWVAAVCPNCHREIHHGFNGAAKNEMLQGYLATIES
jgi:5-methylcytosine-specific restriction protein A